MNSLQPLDLNKTQKISPIQLPPGYTKSGQHNQPSFTLCPNLERFCLRHIARHITPKLYANKPARIAVVQGNYGEGKTQSVQTALSRNKIDYIIVPATQFAGKYEDSASDAFSELETSIKKITEHSPHPIALLIDDADLTVANVNANMTHTPNAMALMSQLQYISDGNGFFDFHNRPTPIFFTGNDFTSLRGSILRPGRALFYTHAPSVEDKAKIVVNIFGFNKPTDFLSIKTIIADHSKQPVAFFHQLLTKVHDARLDALIATHGLNGHALTQEFSKPTPITINELARLASLEAVKRAHDFTANQKENSNEHAC